jgi:preprotein translocase subunit YajC
MLISPAFAQAAGAGGGAGGLGALLQGPLPLLLAFVLIFYIFIIRPQNKRAREHREMVANLRRGDTVVTAGGIIGKVATAPDEREAVLEIADGVRVRVVKSTITEVRGKGRPAETEAKAGEAEKKSD